MNGVQRYRCWCFGKQFLGGKRIDTATIWREYSELKQTYGQLAEKYGCSPRTIKRKLDAYIPPKGMSSPGRAVVVMDTTYWGRKYGVMLFKDALTGRDLLWYFVKSETNALYAQGIAELEGMGYVIPAVVFDGRKGLPAMFPDKKVQLCQFHQQKTVRKYLTKHPKTEAAIELKAIVDMLTNTDKESFVGMFDEWCEKWDGYLKERTTDTETGKSHYTHKRLRSAPEHQAEPAAAVHLVRLHRNGDPQHDQPHRRALLPSQADAPQSQRNDTGTSRKARHWVF